MRGASAPIAGHKTEPRNRGGKTEIRKEIGEKLERLVDAKATANKLDKPDARKGRAS